MANVNTIAMKVLLAMVAIYCCLSTCSAVGIDCYTCDGTVGTVEGDACADGTNKTTSTGNGFCTFSGTTLGTFNRRVTRSGYGGGLVITGYIEGCSNNICYCNTTLCNGQAIEKTTVSCYVCESVELFDNGCGNGDYWDPKSKYVRQETECTTCSKTQDLKSITRGCVYSIHSFGDCTGSDGYRTCYCSEDDCNHASALLSAYNAYLVIGVSFILKYLN